MVFVSFVLPGMMTLSFGMIAAGRWLLGGADEGEAVGVDFSVDVDVADDDPVLTDKVNDGSNQV